MKINLPFLLKIGFGCLLIASVKSAVGQDVAYASARPRQAPRQTRQSLVDALKTLEKRHGVVFDYNRRELRDKTVAPDAARATTLDEALQRLLTPFNLTFEKNNAHSYLIYDRDRLRPTPVREPGTPLRPEASVEVPGSPELTAELNVPEREIRGQVTDASTNEALPGVSVVLKGSTRGTTTDVGGAFRLIIPDRSAEAGNATLVFSYVGYETQELVVGSQTTLNVSLKASASTLGEVVVIGYGERQRKDLTGAVSVVGGDDLVKNKAINPELSMQGRLPGVFVSTPGGAPNQRPTVRIRGVNTLGYNEPLYVVDGVPITEYGNGVPQSGNTAQAGDIRGTVNILALINPQDIESISVLKDASSAAIYGVRAANGVVLITTKRGKVGRPRVELAASRGVQNLPKRFEVLPLPEYVGLVREMYTNNPATAANLPNFYKEGNAAYLGNLPGTDWQAAIVQKNAVIEDYSAKVSGGSESTTYYLSGGYSRTESPIQQNNLKRYSLALNLTSKVGRLFEVGFTNRLSYVQALDNSQTDLSSTWRYAPWQPINTTTGFPAFNGYAQVVNPTFAANPNFDPTKVSLGGGPFTITNTGLLYGSATRSNVLGQWDVRETRYNLLRNIGSAYVQLEPLKGLKLRGTFSADWYLNNRMVWQGIDYYRFTSPFNNVFSATNGTSKGLINQRLSRNYNLVKEFSVNYARVFGGHSVDVLVNAMDQKYGYNMTSANNSQINYYNPDALALLNTAPYSTGQVIPENNALQGYLGRLSYNFKSRYYLDATVRRDGTSRFSPTNRWGTFPSLAVAWRLSAESFMKSLTWLSDLKIRVGIGEIGNQETTQFGFVSLVNFNPDYAYGSGLNGDAIGALQNGLRLASLPIENLTWERVLTKNIGFDASLLQNRLTATIEYYDKKTSGILQAVTLPTSAGIDDGFAPVNNIATVRNSGFEFQVGYNGKVGEGFSYSVSGNLTTVKNQVSGLYRDLAFVNGNNRTELSQPIGYLYGYQFGGIFQNQEEIDAYKSSKPGTATARDGINADKVVPGDAYFQDVNGDGVVNANDRSYLGKTIPGYFYGLNLGAGFKGFDLSLFFQGVGDVQAVNGDRQAGIAMTSENINAWTEVRNRWTPSNPSTTLPRAVQGDPASNNRFSDRFVEDASFVRLKNVQLGYTLPQALTSRLVGLTNVRLYLTGNNLITLTRWSGLDPENDAIPPTRSWILGLNVNF